jgi:CO/xanthine dehydrogenase FAD-binding subunit
MLNPHPGLPEFEYLKPASLVEASQFLAQHAGEARPLLGGTDTFVRMRDGFWKDKYLVDVKGLPGMNDLSFDPVKGLRIGAAVPMNRVIRQVEVAHHYPLLVEAAATVASYQLRSRATIVGNICNASPAGDTIGSCILYDGVLEVHGVDGLRDEPLAGFFKSPGKTALKPGDVVIALKLPIPPAGNVGHYIKLGRNKLSDLSIVGVSLLAYPDQKSASGFHFRVALASVAPIPLEVKVVTDVLAGTKISPALLDEAAQAAMDACNPIDDVRGSARYRKYMVRNLVRRGLDQVWLKLGQQG